MKDFISKLRKQKNISNKKGWTAIEFIIGGTVTLFIVLLLFGLFSYTYPRLMIEKYTAVLAQEAKVNGGLTAANVQDFNSQMNKFGFRAAINAYTDSGSALNVAPKGTKYDVCTGQYVRFVSRKSGQKITIEVVVNSNDKLIKGPLEWFNANTLPKNYTFTEIVISERNQC